MNEPPAASENFQDKTSSTKLTEQRHATSLAGDILHGAAEIAAFLYGNRKLRRKIFNLIETKRLPHFRLGAGICARKSVLLGWIAAQENGVPKDHPSHRIK